MLRRRLSFLFLFVLFTDIFAEKNDYNIANNDIEQNGKKEYRSKHRIQSSTDSNQFQAKLFPSNTAKNGGYPQPNTDQSIALRTAKLTRRSSSTSLASSDECRAEIYKYCNHGSQKFISNLELLRCVDDLDNAANLISKACQHLIYRFKYNMAHDPRFDDAAAIQCSKDINLFDECEAFVGKRGSGRLVSCLYNYLANITEPSCRYFINQMQVVVFSDWRLAEYFSDACSEDISKLECGRLDDENESIPHEQGAVVACLSQKYVQLTTTCRKEVFRLAEMQSDDYHLDRALYYACREDRERLCSQTSSGNGRVYRCLYEQKFNSMMTQACRKEVHRRQSLVVANVKLDAPLIRACNSDMIKYKCQVDAVKGDQRSSLVKLLLCLEDPWKKGHYIQYECRRDMLVHRRMLMSDYTLSPEIVSECKPEMIQHCPSLFQQGSNSSIDQRYGKMIHCLLGAARKEKSFSSRCLTVINALIRTVDPGNDIRADPLLETTCRPVIDTLCPRINAGNSNVILCLLHNLKNARMTEECQDRLMEVAYFMARDLRLTPRLMRTCQTNLKTLCQLPDDWSMNKELNDVQVGMYLGCLYQHRQNLDRECQGELKRIMHIRTEAIGLMPEIEDNCLTDLATCKNSEVIGEEFKCLQKKYNKLEEK
ncbi:unnamed protein product, partial [Rotaria magnacalcarata]